MLYIEALNAKLLALRMQGLSIGHISRFHLKYNYLPMADGDMDGGATSWYAPEAKLSSVRQPKKLH